MFRNRTVCLAAAMIAAIPSWPLPSAAADVTLQSLLDEMTDLATLTRIPNPSYTVRQFSSYDRKSDHVAHSDPDWFANQDRGHHIRTEERNGATEWVMMDADGPGSIVRIWSANPEAAGIVRVYLDNAESPAIEMPLSELLGGRIAPFIAPIAGVQSSGWNSYLPIPYAAHCKVTASKPDFYYHINYRTYETDAKVATYSPAVATANDGRIRDVSHRLANAFIPLFDEADTMTFDVAPGSDHTELITADNSAITYLAAQVDAEDIDDALRKCVLTITFDDADVPQINAPLGDFFGTAPGLNTFTSLPLAVADKVLKCAWVMPFRKSARITLHNTGAAHTNVEVHLGRSHYEWSDRSLYFHANWHGEFPLKTRPRRDWTLIDIAGAGRYVGTMLHIMNPIQLWWGEGDEKIYVDHESFPSHFGTGTEDYFGYAWCSPVPFTHAYHNQLRCDGPENYGHTCVSRSHVIDSIPFTKAFQFDLEIWHAWECDIAMAATAYWYARPGAVSTPNRIDPADLVVVTPPPLPEAKKVEGALEAESFEVIDKPRGSVLTEDRVVFGWSDGKQVRWENAARGDAISFGFPVAEAGRYTVMAVFTKATRYGVFQLSINGTVVNEPFDFYSPDVVVTGEIPLGVFDLKQGQNVFRAEIIGRNPRAGKSNMIGLDYLRLEPAP